MHPLLFLLLLLLPFLTASCPKGIGPKLTYGFEIRGSSSKGEDDVVRNNTVKLDPVKNKLWIELLES